MRIELLYPEIANLYGDLANVEYLARCCGAEVVETGLKQTPRFVSEEIALVYLGCTTERGQELIVKALTPHREALERRIRAGGLFLVTGNALELFGKRVENEDGTGFDCLGFFGTTARRDMLHRYNALYLGEFSGGMKIVGFKSQFSHSWGEPGCEPCFTTLRGAGLNPEETREGFRLGGLLATYLQGPLLLLNPPFTKWLLGQMGVESPVLAFEKAAMDVYETRLAEFSDPKTGFVY